jgi:trehalose 6-phosphate phosphatase
LARLKPVWLALPELAARVRDAKRMLVASDYDGTLTPIVAHPRDAGLHARTRRAIAALTRMPGVEMAILSGRRLEDVRRLVGTRGLYLSGLVGLETQSPGGRVETHVPRGRELPRELPELLSEWAARFAGAWIEDKRWTLAAHYRQVTPRAQAAFGTGIKRLLRPYRDRVEFLHGKKVFEVMPAVRWSKAKAIDRWWHARAGDLLISLGDDENDEPVHGYVRRRGGISVAIGRSRSRAEYVLGSSDEVTWWLEWLTREISSKSSGSKASGRDVHARASIGRKH